MNTQRLTTLVLIVFLSLSTLAHAKEDQAPASAIDAAQSWVSLVDDGQYDQSWEAAAGYFRQAVTRAQWRTALTGIRPPLGNVISRTVKASETRSAMPGAPDGKYVIITFTTAFANKAQSVETITVMREKDDSWAVAGYFIR